MKVRPTHPSELPNDGDEESPQRAVVTVTFSEEEATIIAHVLNRHIEELNEMDPSVLTSSTRKTMYHILEVISNLHLILVDEYDDHL